MSITRRPGRHTVAALIALGLVGAGLAATSPATAATTAKSKAVVVTVGQYPRLVDNPGAEHDVVRFTKVPGATWKLDDRDVDFRGGATTADVPVTEATTATVHPVEDDAVVTWTLPTGTPTRWHFAQPSADEAPAVNVAAATAIWTDHPGTRRDTVTLSRVAGVRWSVTTDGRTATYEPHAFGTKPSLTVRATPNSRVTAGAIDGYDLPLDGTLPEDVESTTTDAGTVTYTTDKLDALVQVGENPHDSVKGYGPGAARESVRIIGAAGIKWQVGNLRPRAVTGVAYLPVDPDDLEDGAVTVKAYAAAKGYSVSPGWETSVEFTDTQEIPIITVNGTDVKANDAAGTTKDTLVLVAQQGMTWWVGQANPRGKIVYTALKPAKNGLATYRVRHAVKATTDATVHVKAVNHRGYVVDTTDLEAVSYDFDRDTKHVPAEHVDVDGADLTFRPHEGIVSWTVKYSATVGMRTTKRTLTVSPSAIEAANAESMTFSFPSGSALDVKARLARDYTSGP